MSGSRYLDAMRGQYRSAKSITSKQVLAILAVISMISSGIFWWGVQSSLTPSRPIAFAFTAILVLAPPTLVSFLVPWSPGGMLLQKINARTWGYLVVTGCALFLLYYSFQIQVSWWLAQPVVADSNLVYQQAIIGVIGFIVIPALLWTPVTSEELVEQVRQAHLVKRYELQTQADIAILRSTLLRAQEKALVGFANLSVEEREELSAVMAGLISGIDRTLREVGQSVKAVSGAMVPFDALEDNEEVQEILEYIGESLSRSTLTDSRTGEADIESWDPQKTTVRMVEWRTASGLRSARVVKKTDDGYLVNTPKGPRVIPTDRCRTYLVRADEAPEQ